MNIEEKRRQYWKMIEHETKRNSIAFDYYGGCKHCEHMLCCKINPPHVITNEIHKIANFLEMKDEDFIKKYLLVSNFENPPGIDDKDYFVNQLPCPFLDKDDKCKIYHVRPLSCKMYPFQIGLDVISIEGVEICQTATLIDSDIDDYFKTQIKKHILKREIEEREKWLKKISGIDDTAQKNHKVKLNGMTEKMGVGIEEQGYSNFYSSSLFYKAMRKKKIFF